VADALEARSVFAGGSGDVFVPNTPNRLRAARTCYDHLAGTLGISLHDRFTGLRWLKGGSRADNTYNLTPAGEKGFAALGIDIQGTRALRRRFAYPCVDWSERRPHVDGACCGVPGRGAKTKVGRAGPGQQSPEHHKYWTERDAGSIRSGVLKYSHVGHHIPRATGKAVNDAPDRITSAE